MVAVPSLPDSYCSLAFIVSIGCSAAFWMASAAIDANITSRIVGVADMAVIMVMGGRSRTAAAESLAARVAES